MPTGDPEAGKGGQQSGGYGGDEGNLGDAQEGQASPSGPTGSPSGGHPDNDPSTGLSYGSNQTEADLNFQDLDAVENAMRSVAIDVDYSAYDDPSKTGVPSKTSINVETFAKNPYGKFSPNRTENYERNRGLKRGLGLQTQDDIDNAAQTERNIVEANRTFFGLSQDYDVDDDTINAPQNPMETAQFDMEALDAHLQSRNTFGLGKEQGLTEAQQKQVDRAIAYEAVVKGMPIYGTGGGFAAKSATGGKTNPHAPAFSAKFGPSVGNVFEGQTQDSLSQAPPSQDDPNTAIFGSAATSPTTAPTTAQITQAPHALDVIEQENIAKALAVKNAATDISLTEAQQKQLDRAIAYEAAIKGKTGMLDAFRDLMGKLEETETKTYFGFEMQVPKMSKFAKEKELVAFREKYGKEIEAYNKHHNKQAKAYKEEPGLINPAATLAGLINPLLGIAVRIGQKYGYNESDVEKALTAAEIDAGIKEAEHGEDITKEACEAMGYRWDGGLQACFKSDGTIHQGNWGAGENAVSSGGAKATADSGEVYNPYVGMV